MADTDTRLSANDQLFLEHARTYHQITKTVKWLLVGGAALGVVLVLYFATSTSFLGSLAAGVIIFALGSYAMRHGLAHSSERESAPPELRNRMP